MSDTVLVTGGTGYVARACIAELLGSGYKVVTTVRSEEKIAGVRKAVDGDGRFSDRLTFVLADLLADAGWDLAVSGCRHVFHVASPLGLGAATQEQMIHTAVDGTLRVLAAAVRHEVERVIMTSAANASSPVSYEEEGVTDETLWTDADAPGLTAYRRSKTLAERAAWNFMASAGGATQLTTILPGAVFGPALSPDNLNSVQVIGRMLRGEMPGIPRIGFEVVDVRDLADIHVRAMITPEAAGERFLATGEFLWMSEIAEILRTHCGEAATKVPTTLLPDELVRKMAESEPAMRDIAIALGRKNRHSLDKAKAVLGWTPRSARETITDCADSLISWGLN